MHVILTLTKQVFASCTCCVALLQYTRAECRSAHCKVTCISSRTPAGLMLTLLVSCRLKMSAKQNSDTICKYCYDSQGFIVPQHRYCQFTAEVSLQDHCLPGCSFICNQPSGNTNTTAACPVVCSNIPLQGLLSLHPVPAPGTCQVPCP